MTTVNPSNEMKQNQTFFHRIYSNLTPFFIGHKILKYFNDFFIVGIFQFHCKSEHEQVNKMKLHGTCANLTVFFLIYKK